MRKYDKILHLVALESLREDPRAAFLGIAIDKEEV